MSKSREEQETIILYNEADKTASVSTKMQHYRENLKDYVSRDRESV